MYNIKTLSRLISKKGVDYAINTLTSPTLPEHIKEDLGKCNIFIDGYLNLDLIYSLS